MCNITDNQRLGTYIEFHQISQGTQWIYVGNNFGVEVKGLGTCKFVLWGGQTLLDLDILYALDIRRNLICVNVLLELGYFLHFSSCTLTIYFGSKYALVLFLVILLFWIFIILKFQIIIIIIHLLLHVVML